MVIFFLVTIIQVKIYKPGNEKYSIAVSLDQINGADISPLLDVLMASESSDIDAVDILQESHSSLSEEHLMALMRAVGFKLRGVDLQEMSLTKELLRSVLVSSKMYIWVCDSSVYSRSICCFLSNVCPIFHISPI